jgi:hypothetical protein
MYLWACLLWAGLAGGLMQSAVAFAIVFVLCLGGCLSDRAIRPTGGERRRPDRGRRS